MDGKGRGTDEDAHHVEAAGRVQARVDQVGGVVPRWFGHCILERRRNLCASRVSSAGTRHREIQGRGGASRTCRRLTRARPDHAACGTSQQQGSSAVERCRST